MSLALIYLALLSVAEAFTTLVNPYVGLVMHCAILLSLIFQGATSRQTSRRRFLLTLVLAPLIRILSITLPLRGRPLTDWYLIIGGLLFLAAYVTARVTGLGRRRLGINLKSLPIQLSVSLIGIGLGFIEYFILGPSPLLERWNWLQFLSSAVILLVFTGILEEVVFRGLIQEAALETLGRTGIVYVAFLFAILHLGYLSFLDVMFVFGVGLMFGLIAARTQSLLGVSLAHGLTNISMYLIFPFVLVGTVGLPILTPSGPQDILAPYNVIPHFPGQYLTATPTPIRTPGIGPGNSGLEVTPTIMGSPLASTATIPSPCSPPPGWVSYIVQPGDTLSELSRIFSIGVAQLQVANCMGASTLLRSGQSLYVPYALTVVPQNTDTPTLTPSPTATVTDTPPQEISATPSPTLEGLSTSTDTPTGTSPSP